MPKPIIQIRTTDGETRTVITDSDDFSYDWKNFTTKVKDGTGVVKVVRIGLPNKVAYIPVRHIVQFWESIEPAAPHN